LVKELREQMSTNGPVSVEHAIDTYPQTH